MSERTSAAELPVYSKDYWDNVFEQLGRRPLVKAALALLALMYASAIYAPWIANDRPYVLEAIDVQGYDSARKGLVGVTRSFVELLEQGPAGFAESQPESGSGQTYEGALDAEELALALRVETMCRYLAPELRAPLLELQASASTLRRSVAAGESIEAGTESLPELARELRTAYEPSSAAAGAEEGIVGVVLQPFRERPLLRATTGVDVFFMVLWLFVLGWPLWNRLANRVLLRRDRERIRRARRKKLAIVLGTSLAFGLGWHVLVGGRADLSVAPYKKHITEGAIRDVSTVRFAPIVYGFDETNTTESFRPPTWLANSELDERGYYVRGPRVPVPDPITGFVQESQPVVVLRGEPERNSGARHPLGTDILGRDLLVRMLYGGRTSLVVGLVSTLLVVTIGVITGSLAGYFGGRMDLLLSRLIEVIQSVPTFFLILTAVALVPEEQINPIFTIVIVIGLVGWTGVARLVRGEFLKLKAQEFVVAARALGLGWGRVIFRHVLPNAMGPVLVAAAFSVASGILIESTVSFLGFGVKHPIPSWGSLLNESRAADHWWLQLFPGFLIFLTVFSYNLVGEGIRDALDPRTRV